MELISIKNDIKFPKDWIRLNKIIDEQYLNEVFNEAIDIGIYDKENINESWIYFYNSVEVISYVFPFIECKNQLKLAAIQIHLQYLIDDYLDSNDVNDDISINKINEIEEILLTGEIKNNDRSLNIYALYYRNKIKEYSHKENKEYIFDLIIKSLIDWLKSIIPFNKLIETNENNQSNITGPHIELFLFLRKSNIGIINNMLIYMLFRNYVDLNNILLLNNLNWNKMIEQLSTIVSIINDIASYSKEKKHNNLNLNYLYIYQNRNYETFNNSYYYLINLINDSLNNYQLYKSRLLNDYKNKNNDLLILINHIQIMVLGYFDYCLKSNRFKCSVSQFKEIKITPDNISNFKNESYNLILKKLYKE